MKCSILSFVVSMMFCNMFCYVGEEKEEDSFIHPIHAEGLECLECLAGWLRGMHGGKKEVFPFHLFFQKREEGDLFVCAQKGLLNMGRSLLK